MRSNIMRIPPQRGSAARDLVGEGISWACSPNTGFGGMGTLRDPQ